jgi:hypothetical protein
MQSSPLSYRRPQAEQTKARLNQLLRSQRQRTPFFRIDPLQIDDRPLFLLIDADSMAEREIIEWLVSLHSSSMSFKGWICANRILTKVERWLDHHRLIDCIQTYQAPKGNNEADRFLIKQSQNALKSTLHSAALVCTLDRDLFVIADAWRLANRPVFLAPLRLGESGRHLVNRARSQGIPLVTSSLDQFTFDS